MMGLVSLYEETRENLLLFSQPWEETGNRWLFIHQEVGPPEILDLQEP